MIQQFLLEVLHLNDLKHFPLIKSYVDRLYNFTRGEIKTHRKAEGSHSGLFGAQGLVEIDHDLDVDGFFVWLVHRPRDLCLYLVVRLRVLHVVEVLFWRFYCDEFGRFRNLEVDKVDELGNERSELWVFGSHK